MDVYNVAEQYTQLIAGQRQTLQKAKARRKSRADAYAKFMLVLMSTGGREEEHMIHSSFIPPAYPPCIADVAELRRIAIGYLQFEMHHRGTCDLSRRLAA